MYKELIINDFRQFKEQSFLLGKYLTVLSGRNSTGKSQVLGILANSGESKKTSKYTKRKYRAEFSEILHGSEEFDESQSNRIKINISDDEGNICDYRDFRTTWQKNSDGTSRFRLIPKKILDDNKKTESKMPYPVIYLGLSRLFPIGEAEEKDISNFNVNFVEEDRIWFESEYKRILSLHDEIMNYNNYSIGETDKKKGFGIKTKKYDYLTNSSGQDNLGQILLAMLSMREIKREDSTISNGLLLVDEIDSTLHPAAQKRLIDLMIREAREFKYQVVVTTHSTDLLKHISSKIAYNEENKNNNVELYYFTNANRNLEVKRNIDYSFIENDLLVQSIIQNPNKVKVYSEDAENRWFFKNILKDYLHYVEILDVNIGCAQLMDLYKCDPTYFGNCLIIFDGDVSEKTLNIVPHPERKRMNNILMLPGTVRPEEVVYKYLISLDSEHCFWESAAKLGLTWDYFNENGPLSNEYSKYSEEREKYKEWFKAHQNSFDSLNLYKYWEQDNEEAVKLFLDGFIKSYESISKRTLAMKLNVIRDGH